MTMRGILLSVEFQKFSVEINWLIVEFYWQLVKFGRIIVVFDELLVQSATNVSGIIEKNAVEFYWLIV